MADMNDQTSDENDGPNAPPDGTHEGDTGELGSAGDATRRRRILSFIAAVIAFQMLAPLTYYLRDDPYDERFAWRMFSAVRMHRCETSATETIDTGSGERVRPIDLYQEIHEAWVNHLRRNRRDVVHRFLEKRCTEPGVSEVRVVNRCVTADDTALAPQDYVLDCATGRLTEPAEPIAIDPEAVQ